ncbi:MAG: uracil-DNA glycosylase [Deltaproteobacteria bacterium]|nr:uracil-DNA glycosylase [Deltaproteobacteria bacterium]MBW1952406.1 uracil-DNA glycosylase [Deltaproteobacteria bacterium]MBW1985917.1 uracil-DNA glycosylase [Deltaproteobacteria bacterium]MBW2133677.1 uracil-DNA glycosylase [Deltaproteobacteria bacterium]
MLNCQRCQLALTRTKVLAGEGKVDSRLLLIAQAPGELEDREGRMFIGPSGPILDEFLKAAGLSRTEIYMTNLVKCHLPKNRRPKQEEIDACSPYLAQEIAIIMPAVLVPLGYFATRYILAKYNASRPAARSEFRNLYGKLILAVDQKIFPLPHPSALLYNRSFKPAILEMYKKLRVLSQPCKWYPLCPMRRFYEQGRLAPFWIEYYCQGDWESCVRYQMEEKGEYHSDTMLPDGSYLETLP